MMGIKPPSTFIYLEFGPDLAVFRAYSGSELRNYSCQYLGGHIGCQESNSGVQIHTLPSTISLAQG